MDKEKIHHIHLSETESTNKYARTAPESDFTLITTDYQTAGRGQRGNSWESEAGKNLLFSLIIRPEKTPAVQQFVLCEIISVAICDVLSQYAPDIHIKWPNDIYYRNHKLCGILIEHDLEGRNLSRSIIGVGLNVNQAHFTSDAPNPISLYQILCHEVNREALLEAIISRFTELYGQYSYPSDSHSLHSRYTSLLYRLDQLAPYRDIQGTFTARLHHVEPDGRLILQDTAANLRSYRFKEVSFVLKPQNNQK